MMLTEAAVHTLHVPGCVRLPGIAGGVLGLMFAAPEVAWVKLVGMIIAAALGDFVAVHYKKEYTGRGCCCCSLAQAAPFA